MIGKGVYKNAQLKQNSNQQMLNDLENSRVDRRKISNVQQHTSDYNDINDIRDSPLQSVIDDEIKENVQK